MFIGCVYNQIKYSSDKGVFNSVDIIFYKLRFREGYSISRREGFPNHSCSVIKL